MIDISLETGPANEKVRQKLMMPFSFVISPGSLNGNIQTMIDEVQSFPRCQKCGAYFSKYCQKDDQNSTWTCDICSHQNTLLNENESEKNSFPEISSDDFQFVKRHQLGEEITVIYVSLNFNPKDFTIISKSIADFLQNSSLSRPILFLFGQKEHDFSILAPYKTSYFIDSQNNNIITRIMKDPSESDLKNDFKTNNLPASIFNLSTEQLSKEDISKFIFSPDQYSNIIKTIEKISPIPKPSVPFSHFVNSIETLRTQIQAKDSQIINPIHFISIMPSIDNYFSSRQLRKWYDSLLRIDILTPTYNDEFQDTIQNIPGSVSLFNSGNLVRNLCKILLPPFPTKSSTENSNEDNDFNSKFYGLEKRGQGTVYQWNSLARSSGSRTTWRFSKVPFVDEDKNFTFSPVLPSTEQPFVLDIQPDGTSDFVNIQITAKMFMIVPQNNDTQNRESDFTFYSSVLRVFNRKIKLSSDVKKIADSINVNTLLWLWMTRTLGQSQRDVLAAVYRSTARIIEFLIDDDQNEQKNEIGSTKKLKENKKIADIVFGCCALKFSDIMSQDEVLRNLSRYSLVLSPPSRFRLIPKYDDQKKVAVYGNTVFFEYILKDKDDDQNEQKNEDKKDDQNEQKNEAGKKVVSIEVLNELFDVLFLERVNTPIPDWCKSPDRQTLEFIHTLVSD